MWWIVLERSWGYLNFVDKPQWIIKCSKEDVKLRPLNIKLNIITTDSFVILRSNLFQLFTIGWLIVDANENPDSF